MGASSNVADYLLETGADDAVALIEPGRVTTYAQLRHQAAAVAAALNEQGLRPGSRVGILGPNSPFWVAGYLAVLKLGLVAVPFASVLTPDEVTRNARIADLGAILIDPRSHKRLSGSLPKGLVAITEEALAAGATPYWPEDDDTDPHGDAALMFTSGTTAGPRAVRVTHRNIAANTGSIIEYLGLRPSDRTLVILPFSYCFGASVLHTHLRSGASLALCASFAFPETAVELAESTRCTGLAGVPSSYQLLLRASSFGTRPLPALRMMQQAGGKLPVPQLQALIAAQPHAQLFVMYGQTEATARLSYLPPDRLGDKLGSIGRGIPGVTLTVVDDTGEPVAPGMVGEIVACGDNVSPGYLGDPAATAEKFPGGALRTGDLATVDDEGFIFVLDRKDDFIKTWGYRVASQDIEAAALQMPELVSAAVVGVPDPTAGEAVTLFATVQTGVSTSPRAIQEYLRTRLAKHMVPERVHVVDALPLNANGKVVKAQLRAWAVAS